MEQVLHYVFFIIGVEIDILWEFLNLIKDRKIYNTNINILMFRRLKGERREKKGKKRMRVFRLQSIILEDS